MSRTIVVSDLHGSVTLLEYVFAHAGFSPEDRLVIAGDFIDVGTDDVLGAARAAGAETLAGNHEVAAATGLRIAPQNPDSLERGAEFASAILSGELPIATAAEGWLITHGGLSSAFADLIAHHGGDADAIAAELNRRFRDEVTEALDSAPLTAEHLDRFPIIGSESGPLWFRPTDLTLVPRGLNQVVGHTPPELFSAAELAELEMLGWRLIEPGGHAKGQGLMRYAVIEKGDARVITE